MTFKYNSFDHFIQSLDSSTFPEMDLHVTWLSEKYSDEIFYDSVVMPFLNAISKMGLSANDTFFAFYFIINVRIQNPLSPLERKLFNMLLNSINGEDPLLPDGVDYLWAYTNLIDSIMLKNIDTHNNFISFLLSPVKSSYDIPEAFSRYDEHTTYYEFLNNEPAYVSCYFPDLFTGLQQSYYKSKIDQLNISGIDNNNALKKLTKGYYNSFEYPQILLMDPIKRYCQLTSGTIDSEGFCCGLSINYLINKQYKKSNINSIITILSLNNLTDEEIINIPTHEKITIDEFINSINIEKTQIIYSSIYQKDNKEYFIDKSIEFLEKYSECAIGFVNNNIYKQVFRLLKTKNNYILIEWGTFDSLAFDSLDEIGDYITTFEGGVSVSASLDNPKYFINQRTDTIDIGIEEIIFIRKPGINELAQKLSEIPENEMLFFTFTKHTVGLIKQDGTYYYYDANLPNMEYCFYDPENLSTFILNTIVHHLTISANPEPPLPYKNEKIPYHQYVSPFKLNLESEEKSRADIYIIFTSNYAYKIDNKIKMRNVYWDSNGLKKYLKYLIKNNNVTKMERLLEHCILMFFYVKENGIEHIQSDIVRFIDQAIVTIARASLLKKNEQFSMSIKKLLKKHKERLDITRCLGHCHEKIDRDPDSQNSKNLIVIAQVIEDAISDTMIESDPKGDIEAIQPIPFLQHVSDHVETELNDIDLKEQAEQTAVSLYKQGLLQAFYRKALQDKKLGYMKDDKILVGYQAFCKKADNEGYIDSLAIELSKADNPKAQVTAISKWAKTHNKVGKDDIEKRLCYFIMKSEHKRVKEITAKPNRCTAV